MKTIKGPAILLAQFAADESPFDSLDAIAAWAADCGFKGVQIPSWDSRLIDLRRAARSRTYCAEIVGTLAGHGIHQ
jgi:sugar phosphate isomerase/epimerase